MSLGKGAVASYSRKHKLNTKSSTESEIVSVDQVMPEVCWTYNFLEAQGYSMDYSDIFQDNISAQLLEINSKLSSTKRTKHIKVKFFFVEDKVDKGEVKITDCPMEVMWADVNSKPLQGTLFKVMRDKLMNCGVNYEDGYWADQPAASKQPAARKQTAASKPPSALKNSKPGTAYHTSAQECVGRKGCFKDPGHGSRIVTRAHWGQSRVSWGQSRGGLAATRVNQYKWISRSSPWPHFYLIIYLTNVYRLAC